MDYSHNLQVAFGRIVVPVVADLRVEEDLPDIPKEEHHRTLLPVVARLRPFLKQAVHSPKQSGKHQNHDSITVIAVFQS